uniref:Uncharacterized protein n=1 Tax=Octopus bimaculoides TaxID=37653 RepID=A0A0L8HF22_OCTBM
MHTHKETPSYTPKHMRSHTHEHIYTNKHTYRNTRTCIHRYKDQIHRTDQQFIVHEMLMQMSNKNNT